MKVTLTQKAKEAAARLLKKSAERDYDENSFWADEKKRKFVIFGIVAALIVIASSLMPEQHVRAKRGKNEYQLVTDDISGESNKPTTVFSEGGADKLDEIASADLLKVMETEMQAREEQVQDERDDLAKEKQAIYDELDEAEMKMQQQKRDSEAKHKNALNQLKDENKQNIQNVVNALMNGEDISKLAPGVKLPENANPYVANQGGFNRGNSAQNLAPNTVVGPRNSSAAQSNYSAPTMTRGIPQSGIRVVNSGSSMRVATGQMLDKANGPVSANGEKSKSLTIFEQLAEAKAQLRSKQNEMRIAAESRAEVIKQEKIRKSNLVPLTAGSIISGTLMNGSYVPTGSNASNDPMPGIFRIKREALMPNFNVSEEVKECVIVASAKPIIESTRVDYRASTITCIRDDGTATEDSIKAVATGRDGSTGVPATLISRNGEMLAKTAMAGFLQGLTDIFSQTSLEVNSEDGVYAISGKQMTQLTGSAALGGAGTAMERLADYYMELADKMQPTLKVSPGVEVDFIVTSLSVLDFNEDTGTAQQPTAVNGNATNVATQTVGIRR
ncbi:MULTISPECIES: TrbI/VirB10 family protein [Vibrio harveyi group]|uniref:TrbI/VirB10 family protein n=1 Tax=Vibrio harveyi group TaxID=717610 RepID=UPI00037221A5|nr:TrbI/VirB10 family protein [Vibrio owensii]